MSISIHVDEPKPRQVLMPGIGRGPATWLLFKELLQMIKSVFILLQDVLRNSPKGG